MLRTAIDLKNAIDAIPTKLDPVGLCPSIEDDWLEYERDVEVMCCDPDDDKVCDTCRFSTRWLSIKIGQSYEPAIKASTTFIQRDYCFFTNECTLIIRDNSDKIIYDGNFNINGNTLNSICETGKPSPFGDMKTMETVVDSSVRSASEILSDRFDVSENVITELKKLWQDEFTSSEVKVVPYKINFYRKGGMFKPHRDTPEKDLIGTMLISLSRNSLYSGGDLVVETNIGPMTWKACQSEVCAFYPDLVHEVKEVTDGIRATLAFKIYSVGTQPTVEEQNEQVIDRTLPLLKEIQNHGRELGLNTIGLIMTHEYNLDSNVMKGGDLIYCQALQKMGWKISAMPILIKFEASYDHDGSNDDQEVSAEVYPLLNEHIEYSLGRGDKPITPYDGKNILFFTLGTNGVVWSSESTPSCAYTGNECQPGEENSIYLNKALIIEFPSIDA